jgi:hypothetical protein
LKNRWTPLVHASPLAFLGLLGIFRGSDFFFLKKGPLYLAFGISFFFGTEAFYGLNTHAKKDSPDGKFQFSKNWLVYLPEFRSKNVQRVHDLFWVLTEIFFSTFLCGLYSWNTTFGNFGRHSWEKLGNSLYMTSFATHFWWTALRDSSIGFFLVRYFFSKPPVEPCTWRLWISIFLDAYEILIDVWTQQKKIPVLGVLDTGMAGMTFLGAALVALKWWIY